MTSPYDQDWAWVSDAAFDAQLEELLSSTDDLVGLLIAAGAYSDVKEYLNNQVLEALAEKKGRDPETGRLIDDAEDDNDEEDAL